MRALCPLRLSSLPAWRRDGESVRFAVIHTLDGGASGHITLLSTTLRPGRAGPLYPKDLAMALKDSAARLAVRHNHRPEAGAGKRSPTFQRESAQRVHLSRDANRL